MIKNIKKSGSILLENGLLLRKSIFTTDEAEQILGWPRKELNLILFRLVKKGRLGRIKRGLFCILPPGTKDSKQGYPQNWFLIAKALAGEQACYISHYSAMQLHGMTGEPIQTVFASLPEQRHVPSHLRIPIRLVTLPKTKFWGLEETWVTNEEKVWTSDRERTMVDILDRPDLAGGIMEIARGIWLVKKEIDSAKLITYAKRFGSYAAAKRLGFLMERLSIGSEKEIEELHKFTNRAPSYALLDPTIKKTGTYIHRWRLCLNLEPSQIEKNIMT